VRKKSLKTVNVFWKMVGDGLNPPLVDVNDRILLQNLHAVADPAKFQKELKTYFFTAAHNVY